MPTIFVIANAMISSSFFLSVYYFTAMIFGISGVFPIEFLLKFKPRKGANEICGRNF